MKGLLETIIETRQENEVRWLERQKKLTLENEESFKLRIIKSNKVIEFKNEVDTKVYNYGKYSIRKTHAEI